MSETIMTEELMEAAILGGAVLGGGGGGSMKKGRLNGKEALSLGTLRLVDIDDVPPNATLITASAVGAPAATEAQVSPKDYVRTIELLSENGCPEAEGFIPNECGGSSITNGWVPAAQLNLPVVDALCNGRAHPTGTMGSMGLHKDPKYVSRQAAAGGNPSKGLHLELYAAGKLDIVAPLIRAAADRAGGLVAVARNPVEASYAKKYGAPGALRQAIALGQVMKRKMTEKSPQAAVEAAAEFLDGQVITRAPVAELELITRGGFDSGRIVVGDFETAFWNEFMTLEQRDERLGTFPDLVMTFDASSGLPVTTAELKKGQEVYLLLVPASRLILGEGMRCKDLLETIEPIIGKKILEYTNLQER
ncbi:MAG: DUF917 family protein [Synergistaceae bacterium]|nr:DUF917 family protein [Synergistaceae bacterium]